MNLIINNISKEYLGHTVLDQVSFFIGEREFVGLIGENGSGKTTLLKIIAGLEKADDGSFQLIRKDATVGYIPQAPEIVKNKIVRDFLTESLNLQPEESYKIDIALSEIGISELVDRKFDQLSSGQRTKVFLARLLVNKPDLLLLDEPTNHLDQESLEWLEKYLSGYNGSALVVSHDRRFLDNLVDKVIELDKGKVKVYGGNYTFYREQKKIEQESQLRQFEGQQRTIKRLEKDIAEKKVRIQKLEKSDRPTRDKDKFAATFFANRASRKFARVAQSLETRLEKIEQTKKPEPDLFLRAIFKPKAESAKTVLYLKNVSKKLGKKVLFENLNLLIERGEKVVLLGANGSGKTTLINIILGKTVATNGIVKIGNNVEIGFLPQEQAEISSSDELLDYLTKQVTQNRTSAYKLARSFLFSDDNLRTPVKDLSSGQKSRLALAKIMSSGANFIILDEPTNHLDIPAREALESAIASYSGTLLLVTHDRCLLDVIVFDKVINLSAISKPTVIVN